MSFFVHFYDPLLVCFASTNLAPSQAWILREAQRDSDSEITESSASEHSAEHGRMMPLSFRGQLIPKQQVIQSEPSDTVSIKTDARPVLA